jgi:hypothetical protein
MALVLIVASDEVLSGTVCIIGNFSGFQWH